MYDYNTSHYSGLYYKNGFLDYNLSQLRLYMHEYNYKH